MSKTLVVILGPTGIGKTELALHIAKHIASPIINCDSRQIYKDIPIGTAAPTKEQQGQVEHYFVQSLPLNTYYSAAQYETDVILLTEKLFKSHDRLLLTGGSMMYMDAVCQGIDDIPSVDEATRTKLKHQFQAEGLEPLLAELSVLDPAYYQVVDKKNHKRVIHALEICRVTGKPYSTFRVKNVKERPFSILKIGLQRPREELFQRINQRVDQMIMDGLMEEATRLYSQRDLNALNTVGYKEMFQVIEGNWPLDFAIERIKKNTRVYAKKQMTWFAHDDTIHWFHPTEIDAIIKFIDEKCGVN